MEQTVRYFWLQELLKISKPVLESLAIDTLRIKMPYATKLDPVGKRKEFANLEAFARVFNGISPWLALKFDELEEEEYHLQKHYKNLCIRSLSNIVNPKAKDYVDFGCGAQCLVDAAYLCQGFLRNEVLWKDLTKETQQQVFTELEKTRKYEIPENNWLLFAAIVEAFLLKFSQNHKPYRLKKGVLLFVKKFYVGDGIYSDGKDFTFNYYNSFVIHPMLTDILNVCHENNIKLKKYYNLQVTRQKRYTEILEHMISPDGTFPILGRTISCRLGAFHALAHSVLNEQISPQLTYGQIRTAMTALLTKQFGSKVSNYSEEGWLKIGFIGEQLSLAEEYINIGSSYHTCSFFLPLGLSYKHPFWQEKEQDWRGASIWSGKEAQKDVLHSEKQKKGITWLYKKVTYKLKSLWK